MTFRGTALILSATLALTACGDSASSGLNPLGWFRGGSSKAGPTTLTPEQGYATQDPRQPFPHLTSARWEPMMGGKLLVVTGIAPSKGWWDVAIITETSMPGQRVRPDPDGTLRLIVVGSPPLPESAEARMPADPRVDTVTVARAFTDTQLARVRSVELTGAGNSITLRH